jgi:hypothetical protein
VGDRVRAVDLLGDEVEGPVISRHEVAGPRTREPGAPLIDGPTLFVLDEARRSHVLVKERDASPTRASAPSEPSAPRRRQYHAPRGWVGRAPWAAPHAGLAAGR